MSETSTVTDRVVGRLVVDVEMNVHTDAEKVATRPASPRLYESVGLTGAFREWIEVELSPGQSLLVELPKGFDRGLLEESTWKQILRLCAKFHVAASRFDAEIGAQDHPTQPA